MFGIGFPEMVVITIVALIVVGPEKLPELARTAARTIGELKRSAESLKRTIAEESGAQEIIEEIRPELEAASKNLQGELHNLAQPPSPIAEETEQETAEEENTAAQIEASETEAKALQKTDNAADEQEREKNAQN